MSKNEVKFETNDPNNRIMEKVLAEKSDKCRNLEAKIHEKDGQIIYLRNKLDDEH